MTFAAALVAAKRALDGHDDEAALVALVAAWRVNKQPRIADVVDRVSARIGAAPIEGKTVKARTAAWSTLARKRRTLDVGPLVATPWPGTWKDALPLVELACALPPDPRVAVALAQLVGDERFDTWTARRFFQRVLARITSLGDVRTRSILEAAVAQPRSRYWRDDTKPAVLATIAKLRDLPKLTKSDETAVVAIEACFAETVATERTHARGRAELLAAIYADPDDDTVRSVYADWLTEQGDPQGELIALQLARHRGEQGDRKRELALLRKHAEAWAGPLGSIVTLDRRTFERGFLADVTVDVARISDDFDDPAWATVHTVEVTRTAIPVLTAPALARVRCWRGLTEVDAVELARLGTWPRIDELEVRLAPVASLDRGRILDGVAFPNLRRIAIVADDAYTPIAMLDPARPLERVTVLPRLDRLATVVGLAQRFPIAEVAVGGNRHDRDWLLTMRRDAAGRLTRLHGAPLAGDALPRARGLASALATLSGSELTALVIAPLACTYDDEELALLESQLSRFPGATIDVPWVRVPPSASAVEPVVCSKWFEAVVDEARYRTLWSLVGEPPLGLAFDAMAINDGAHTPIANIGAPLAAFTKRRTRSVSAYRSSARASARLDVHDSRVKIACAFRDSPEFLDAYLDWLAKLDALGGLPATASFVRRGDSDRFVSHDLLPRLLPFSSEIRWITILDDALPIEEVEAIARTLPWLRSRRVGERLALILSPRPSLLPSEQQRRSLERPLIDLAWRVWRDKHGFVPHELVFEALDPLLDRAWFTRSGDVVELALHVCRYHGRNGTKIDVNVNSPLDDATSLSLVLQSTTSTLLVPVLTAAATDLATARAELAVFLARFDRDVLGWF